MKSHDRWPICRPLEAMNMDDTMEGPRSFQVAGVDGCRAGWVVARLRATRENGAGLRYPLMSRVFGCRRTSRTCFLRRTTASWSAWISPSGWATAPAEGVRCGRPPAPRPSCRQYLYSADAGLSTGPVLRDASEAHFQCTGKRLSKQSFLIMDKIRQVDELVTPAMQKRVREIHPEVIFHVLNGNRPPSTAKRQSRAATSVLLCYRGHSRPHQR